MIKKNGTLTRLTQKDNIGSNEIKLRAAKYFP